MKKVPEELKKHFKVNEADVDLKDRGFEGNREQPPEGPEVEVNSVTLEPIILSPEEFENLPEEEFEVEVEFDFYEDDGNIHIPLKAWLKIKVVDAEADEKEVEVEFEEELLEWDYN